ncbi:putative ribonuclease H-like domain-containing protein [Tanacetum coccineum]
MSHPHPKRNFVPRAVLMKSRLKTFNTARQNSSRETLLVNTGRPINTAYPRPIANYAKPTSNVFNRAHSHARMPFNKFTTNKNSNFNEKVNTVRVNVTTIRLKAVVSDNKRHQANAVKASAFWVWRPKKKVLHHEKGVIDSGCSRHMTGNKSYLSDYEEIDGGFVAFGGSTKGGKITGKGKIKTGKLDFEDVVLFTNTECVVLSPDFKLLDENQVLLRVPRKNNMYSVDLKNVAPSGGLTCLFAKATLDESKLWHRRCDNRTEFKNKEMNQLCEMKGIKREFSVARTLQQNGVAERKNKTLIKAARTMLADSKLPTTFWAEAVNTACRKPALSFMRPFGCPVTILNTLDHLGSGPEWIFDIDTLTKSMNYKPVVAENQTNGNAGTKESIDACQAGKKTIPSHEYILLPLCTQNPTFSSSSKDSPDAGFKPSREEEKKDASTVNTTSIMDNVVDENIVYGCADDLNMPNLEEIVYSNDDVDFVAEGDMNNLEFSMPVSPIATTRVHKDHPVEQIIRDLHLAPQTKRMTKSVTEHEPKKVWTLVDLPYGKRAIGTKWVYRNKKDERGIVIRNKARLVPQGYTQEEGIDYDEMDVKSAFLYGKIEEEFYVCQPSGFEDPEFPDRVYKVEKALYGIHQAPRAWYETLSTYLLDNGFQRGIIDKTLFIKKVKSDILLVQVYVDDIIFGSTKKGLCTEFKKLMHKKFQMSSMESTHMETSKPLMKDENAEDVDVHLYRSMIGSLMYLISSRPNIIYLKGQPKLGLWYPKDSPFDLEAYTDSDYAGASLDRKSTTRVANSTTEAEYVAASSCYGQIDDWNGVEMLRMKLGLKLVTVGVTTVESDENVHEEKGDSIERAVTTAASLDAEQYNSSGPRRQDTILGDRPTQTRFERLSKQSNDPPLSRVNTIGSGEDNMKLNELMKICTKLSERILALENIKTAQDLEIINLKKRVKKLEKKKKARTPQLKRRLFKVRIKSSADKSLEDVETQGRYDHAIEINTASTSISTASINVTIVEPITTASAPITTAGVSVSTIEPSTPPLTTTLIEDEDLIIA